MAIRAVVFIITENGEYEGVGLEAYDSSMGMKSPL